MRRVLQLQLVCARGLWMPFHVRCSCKCRRSRIFLIMNNSISLEGLEEVNVTSEVVVGWSAVSREGREVVEAVFYAGLSTLVCIIGIPTNLINIFVFWHQGLKDRMNLCLFALALVDCVYLLCEFIMYPVGSFIIFYDSALGNEYQTKFIAALFGVSSTFRSTSRFIGVIIAVERCVCVVSPLIASTIMKTSAMAITIFTAFLFFQSSYVFHPLSFQAQSVVIGGETYWMFIKTDFEIQNEKLVQSLLFTVLGFFIPVTSLFIVTVATLITVQRLRAAMRWRKKTSSTTSDSVSQQEALTAMLVIVSCIHIATLVPSVTWELTLYFTANLFADPSLWELLKTVSAIANVFPEINSAVTFFVYYFRSSRFRSILHPTSRKAEAKTASSVFTKDTVLQKDIQK